MASLFAAAWGTLLFTFDQTLNNHTVAAYSAFFAMYAPCSGSGTADVHLALRISSRPASSPGSAPATSCRRPCSACYSS